MNQKFLFAAHTLREKLKEINLNISHRIEALKPNELSAEAASKLKHTLIKQSTVDHLDLLVDQATQDMDEIQIDVTHDQLRFFSAHTGGRHFVPGERQTIYVPFKGSGFLFYSQPDQFNFNPPCGSVNGQTLELSYDYPTDRPMDVKSRFEADLNAIKNYIQWQKPMIDAHNINLPDFIDVALAARKRVLEAQASRAAALGIPPRAKR